MVSLKYAIDPKPPLTSMNSRIACCRGGRAEPGGQPRGTAGRGYFRFFRRGAAAVLAAYLRDWPMVQKTKASSSIEVSDLRPAEALVKAVSDCELQSHIWRRYLDLKSQSSGILRSILVPIIIKIPAISKRTTVEHTAIMSLKQGPPFLANRFSSRS